MYLKIIKHRVVAINDLIKQFYCEIDKYLEKQEGIINYYNDKIVFKDTRYDIEYICNEIMTVAFNSSGLINNSRINNDEIIKMSITKRVDSVYKRYFNVINANTSIILRSRKQKNYLYNKKAELYDNINLLLFDDNDNDNDNLASALKNIHRLLLIFFDMKFNKRYKERLDLLKEKEVQSFMKCNDVLNDFKRTVDFFNQLFITYSDGNCKKIRFDDIKIRRLDVLVHRDKLEYKSIGSIKFRDFNFLSGLELSVIGIPAIIIASSYLFSISYLIWKGNYFDFYGYVSSQDLISISLSSPFFYVSLILSYIGYHIYRKFKFRNIFRNRRVNEIKQAVRSKHRLTMKYLFIISSY